jgi:hypothetical protein
MAPTSLTALLLIAALNLFAGTWGPRNDSEAHLTRQGLNNVLQLHARLRSGELKMPVYLSYPRFPDAIKGVYNELNATRSYTMENGFPWSLYRSIVPRIYLRDFETGEVRGNPQQFSRWKTADEHKYRAAAVYLYDLPAGLVWHLSSIRKAARHPEEELRWSSEGGRTERSQWKDDLFGPAPYTRLGKGTWTLKLKEFPRGREDSILFALRFHARVSFRFRGDDTARAGRCSYRWSWQIFELPIDRSSSELEFSLLIASRAEVIGPVVIPEQAVRTTPVSRRNNLPPAGVCPLEIRGGE